jgi:hypothetical protein
LARVARRFSEPGTLNAFWAGCTPLLLLLLLLLVVVVVVAGACDVPPP